MENKECALMNNLLIRRWRGKILYRCRVLVIYTAESVVFGVISRVEATIFAPSTEHD